MPPRPGPGSWSSGSHTLGLPGTLAAWDPASRSRDFRHRPRWLCQPVPGPQTPRACGLKWPPSVFGGMAPGERERESRPAAGLSPCSFWGSTELPVRPLCTAPNPARRPAFLPPRGLASTFLPGPRLPSSLGAAGESARRWLHSPRARFPLAGPRNSPWEGTKGKEDCSPAGGDESHGKVRKRRPRELRSAAPAPLP